jgi:hypothetical protein
MRQVFNPVGMCADPKVEPKPALYHPTCTNEELISYVITYASTDLERELARRLSAAIDECPVTTGENCQCCGAPI